MLSLNTQPIEKFVNSPDIQYVNHWGTIQGEGPFAGTPAIFLRLAGCNLQCPLCFGIGVKSRIPYLSRSYGPKVRLDKVEQGEQILTFNNNFELVETTVKQTLLRYVSKWFEIRISGRVYDVTPEHPFFTTRGLVSAADLEIGDHILEAKPNDIISFKKQGDRNPMKDSEVAARSTANTDYEAVARGISKTVRRKQRNGTYVPTFNRLSLEQQEQCRQRQSEAKRRERNPNWKGEAPNLLQLKEDIEAGLHKLCERCGLPAPRLLVHHHDSNHDNDSRENLAVWCHACHNDHHQRGYNFWNGNRKDGKELVKTHNGQTVQKITVQRGRLPVVNISCAPYDTYLANGMWVHNCDTNYTSDRKVKSFQGLANEIDWNYPLSFNLVVITGGEPFRQNIGPLVNLLTECFHVQIETNGSLYPKADELLHEATIVCSPKTGSISSALADRFSFRPGPFDCYKYVLDHRHVNLADGLPTSVLGLRIPPARPLLLPSRVFVQPADVGDVEENKKNAEAAVASCMKFGYRLCLQIHKIVGLE